MPSRGVVATAVSPHQLILSTVKSCKEKRHAIAYTFRVSTGQSLTRVADIATSTICLCRKECCHSSHMGKHGERHEYKMQSTETPIICDSRWSPPAAEPSEPEKVDNKFFTGWTWQHARAHPFSVDRMIGQYLGAVTRGGIAHLDGVRVGRALRRVDELISKALSNRLNVAERGFTGLEKAGFRSSAQNFWHAKRTPVVRRETDWLTRRRGETSTAWRRTVPWEPIRVESSRGPVLTMASTRT